MKYTLLAAMLFMVACTTNKTKQPLADSAKAAIAEPANVISGANGIISFKADGKKVVVPIVMVGFVKWPNMPKQLVVQAMSSDLKKDMINITLVDFHIGDFAITENLNTVISSGGSYTPDCSRPANSYLFTSGRATVISFDTINRLINGRFSGVFKRISGDKEIKITDGLIENGKVGVM